MKTVICHSCGASVDENVKKCPYCDTIVNENGIDADTVRKKNAEFRKECMYLLRDGRIIEAIVFVRREKGVDPYDARKLLSIIKKEENIPDILGLLEWLLFVLFLPLLILSPIIIALFVSESIVLTVFILLIIIILWFFIARGFKRLICKL